jgi:alcohol dehydrogenase class IV
VSIARLARVAVAMGDTSQASDEVLAGNAIDRVRKLNATVGIPARLRDVGVQDKDLVRIAAKAFEDASHQSNPRKCSESDLLAMVREAF